MKDFRSVVGCVGYMSCAFRPDLSLEFSLMRRLFVVPTVHDAKIAIEILAWAKENRYA